MSTPDWIAEWPGMKSNESLAKHSQYGIGGKADWFLAMRDTSGLSELLRRSHEDNVRVTVIGAGSNTLILDGGVRGIVIHMKEKKMTIINDATVELSGGYMMPRAAFDCAKAGLSGMQFGVGIPGTCGASVIGNAGAFGTEIKDVLRSCDTLAPDGSAHTFVADDCAFAYRTSTFKIEKTGYVVTAARFAVERGDGAAIRAETDAISAQRKASQPYGVRSLGSVFKNPPGQYAGALVEAAGLKGKRIGGAMISEKHANFIVNVDAATATEVVALIADAHDTVLRETGIDLEREIVYVGEMQ